MSSAGGEPLPGWSPAGQAGGGPVSERDRLAASRAAHQSAFLAKASGALFRATGTEQIVRTLLGLLVPEVGDWALFYHNEDGVLRRSGGVHMNPARAALLDALPARTSPAPESPLGLALERRPALVREVDEGWLASFAGSPEGLEALRVLAPVSLMLLPLSLQEEVLGVAVVAAASSGQRYGVDDLEAALDVGLRAAAALENARLNERLQRAVRARDEVLAVVSHDLRDSLQAIRMAGGLLAEGVLPQESAIRQAEVITRASERMERLIGDLLDVARIEAGGFTVSPSPCAVGELVTSLVEFFSPAFAEREVRLVARPAPDLPRLPLDRFRMEQALGNLLSNALKFTPRGGEVALGAGAGPTSVRLTVADSGPGIAEEDLARVFDRFWRGQRREAGAGLGLAIARGVVLAHGGRIWAENRPQGGAAFIVELPLPG